MIDIHGHIGQFRDFDLSLQTLLENIERWRVKCVLVSNIDGAELPGITGNLDEAAANSATEEAVRAHPDCLRGLLWARPEDGHPANLEPFVDKKLSDSDQSVFVGVKFHPEFNRFEADSANVDPYLDFCERHQLPAVFHCGFPDSNSSPQRIYAIARRHPKVAVVLYHMGMGSDHSSAIDVVAESIAKSDAQLYLETAQSDENAVFKAIERVGAERVLFGTDATYFGKYHYEEYASLVKALHDKLPESQFHAIMHDNAKKLFRLDVAD